MQKVYRSGKQMHKETQAYHSRRESLRSSSSRDLEDAVFSFHIESGQNTFSKRDRSNESGNRFVSCVHSVFRNADPAKVGKSLLDGNKDHLLYQARSELVKQECQVGSLNKKLVLKDWNFEQKREASAQRTQADHSRRESLMSSSSREPRVSGKPDAVLSFDNEPILDTFSVRNRTPITVTLNLDENKLGYKKNYL